MDRDGKGDGGGDGVRKNDLDERLSVRDWVERLRVEEDRRERSICRNGL